MEHDTTIPQGVCPLTRRRFLAGVGLAVSAFRLPSAHAQTAPDDEWRVLRAQATGAKPRGDAAPPTPVWAFDGGTPGPLLRVKRGEELRVRLVNELPEPTCVHWHGVRVPNAMDGVAQLIQAPIPLGASFDYRFRPPDAGTFWYHPAGSMAPQAGRGLRGALIVDEPAPVAVDQDLLLFLEDWLVGPDGAVDGRPRSDAPLTINAAAAIEVAVRTNQRLRLRIVNAASRPLALRSDRHAALVIAIDGQPAEPFPARDNRIALAPGNRLDLLVDATLAPESRAALSIQDGRGETPLLRFVYDREPARPAPLAEPKPLPANPLPERLDLRSAVRQDLAFMVPAGPVQERPPVFRVRRNRVVVLTCRNGGEIAQAVHLHGHHCRLLDRLDDGWKPFWLDTLMVAPRQTERLAFLADNPGKWLIEATPLAGAAPGPTQSWFEVT